MKSRKTFEDGELCCVPLVGTSGIEYHYGIVLHRNKLKLRRNFYKVFVEKRIHEFENLFIAKVEEIEK
jgi:hypothetical protein